MNKNIEVIDSDLIQKNGSKYTVTDANGKSFDISLGDIIDTSTDLGNEIISITDSDSNKLLNFSPSITDSLGAVITDSELLDAVKSGKAIALDVTFEATHSGDNLNNTVYTSRSLEEDTKSWMFPYAKPLIKNHDLNEEPIGRAVDASFGSSEFCEGRDTINVTYRVSDADAMTKFADGRYRTMSIGATCGYIRCNICGKDILKDSKLKFCGHWKGETYAGKKATWTSENMTYREGSIVNNPADVYAQVKSIKVVSRKEEEPMSANTDSTIFDDMDSIINDSQIDNTDSQAHSEPEQSESAPNVVGDNNQEDNNGEDNSNDLQAQLDVANARVAELEDEVATLTSSKEAVEDELATAKANLETLSNDNEALKGELSLAKDSARKMAEFNLKLMKDSLMELSPELSDAELEGKTAKEINDMISEAKSSAQTRQQASQASSPGLAISDSNTDVEDSANEEDNIKLTMRDMEEVILNIWNH